MRPLAIAITLSSLALFGQTTKPTAAQAETLVKRAIQYGKQYGGEKLISETNQGVFHVGSGSELYVSVYDDKGFVRAVGFNAKGLVGINGMDFKDSDGKLFFREIITQAKAKGSGWVDYKWKNPTTSAVGPKTTYFEYWDGLIVAAGIYK